MSKIQSEGTESKGGVNEGPTTPRPAPPKGHAPEANSEGRAEPGQVEWPPPGVEWPPPSLETSGLRPPAPSEDEERLLRNQWRAEHERYPAEGSEAEGKKWGKLWLDLLQDGDTIDSHAARFRAECIVPWKELEEAARAVICWALVARGHDVMCMRHLRDALAALPDQGEAPKDKPRLSDYELGSFAWNQGAGRHTLTDDQELNHKIICRLGAAIRAKV